MIRSELKVISGTANKPLAEKIAQLLNTRLTDVSISRFADNEIFVQINESIRGCDVFVVQPTSNPGNETLMELLIILDALKRASAGRITSVIPYYGYARQDRKAQPRTPITSKLVANLLTVAGSNRILLLDVHALQIQGYFDIPVDHLFATPVLFNYFKTLDGKFTVVSPDAGGVERARFFARLLGTTMAIIDKRRISPVSTEAIHILGDVKNKNAIIVDDIIATGSSLVEAAKALKSGGCKKVFAAITHGVLSQNAPDRLQNSPIDEIVITDTIRLLEEKRRPKIKVISVASLFAEAIKRIHLAQSISILFDFIQQ